MRRRWITRAEREERARIAKMLFRPVEKNPYYHRGQEIKNLRELMDNLDKFTESEAPWIASWIEYLGDGRTAAKIRQAPDKFKEKRSPPSTKN